MRELEGFNGIQQAELSEQYNNTTTFKQTQIKLTDTKIEEFKFDKGETANQIMSSTRAAINMDHSDRGETVGALDPAGVTKTTLPPILAEEEAQE